MCQTVKSLTNLLDLPYKEFLNSFSSIDTLIIYEDQRSD